MTSQLFHDWPDSRMTITCVSGLFLGVFDLKWHRTDRAVYDFKVPREPLKSTWYQQLSRYFDVIHRSVCAAPLHVEHTSNLFNSNNGHICFRTVKAFYCSRNVILYCVYHKTLIKAYHFYSFLNSIWLCWTLFLIKQYIKSVSVAHENVSETSVYLTNIAFYSLNL